MVNEISVDAESIVAEKGFLHQQIFNAEERISRLLSGHKLSMSSKGEEFTEKLGIRERNRSLMGEVAYLESILVPYYNEEYLLGVNKIKVEMSTTKKFIERTYKNFGFPSKVEYTLNDYDPDNFFNLCLEWHTLICQKLFTACGYYEAGREGIPFDDEMKNRMDAYKEKVRGKDIPKVPLKFSQKRSCYRGFGRTETS